MQPAVATLLQQLENTEDGVFAVDAHQRIILWSKGAERILGYAPADVVGRRCFEVIEDPGHGNNPCQADCNVLFVTKKGGIPPTQTTPTKTKSGRDVCLNITHITIPEANSRQPQAIVHIFRDVTEQAQAQDLVARLAHYMHMHGLPKQGAASAQPQAASPTTENSLALTPRELEVLRCLADGLGTSEIADRMVISVSTARNHIQSILDKLGAHSRTEAVMAGIRQGLIKPPGNAK